MNTVELVAVNVKFVSPSSARYPPPDCFRNVVSDPSDEVITTLSVLSVRDRYGALPLLMFEVHPGPNTLAAF